MGVTGLWKHLAPAGKRVALESLCGRVLAVDVSIWAVQFMFSMSLKQQSNEFAILDGFLRRILKLIYFGIKPVFVFDGRTPALKLKTLRARKHARLKNRLNVNKAAEKLVHNIVKQTVAKVEKEGEVVE